MTSSVARSPTSSSGRRRGAAARCSASRSSSHATLDRFRSRLRLAKSWRSWDCAAPGTTSSVGRSSATCRSRPVRFRSAAQPIAVEGPADAIRHRLGFVSSKRGEESLAPNLTLRENLFLNPLTVGASPIPARSSPAAERERCMAASCGVSRSVPPSPSDRSRHLSGGNQQKVVVARWMEAGSRLLVLEEPTFGVDVGSKAEIYRLLQEAIDHGSLVLLISSDFEEVAGISTRALIFDRGRVSAELARDELSIARLTALAVRRRGKQDTRRGSHERIRPPLCATFGGASPTSFRSGTSRSSSSS